MKLSPEQIRQFDEEGYVFIPDLFSKDEVGVLMAEVPGIYAQQRKEVVRENDGKTARTAFAAHLYN